MWHSWDGDELLCAHHAERARNVCEAIGMVYSVEPVKGVTGGK